MIVTVGVPIQAQVVFRDQHEAVTPVSVTVSIIDSSGNLIVTDTPSNISLGVYSYSWTPTVAGSYEFIFSGFLPNGSQSVLSSNFVVSPAGTVINMTVAGATDNLEENQYLNFLVNPNPFYVDPEKIKQYFTEATDFEIALLIYDASQEAKDLFYDGILNQMQPLTPTIRTTIEDYVTARAACALSKIYDPTSGSDASAIALGDLHVSTTNNPKNAVNRSNATTWCELAGVLRDELYNLSNRSGMKAVLKGTRFRNPMPERRIRTQEWTRYGSRYGAPWLRDWDGGDGGGFGWERDWG